MSYTALYRRWRPTVFEEVIGQNHITDTLRNQIQSDNIAHAYLFSGTRGTGKTSTAKILARAINCLSPVDQNPCNTCEICTGMLDESLMDIVEIDAASNNGVDDVRELRENVKYPPSNAKFKVYIIDEVHMLSQGAFNALLKTLEEPPGYVVFILATTEPQKIPATILSRCQRYDFKRIPAEPLIDHLKAICVSLEIEAEEKALSLIVRNADGAVRDALSILDQCVSFTDGTLSYNDVVATLGLTTEHWLFQIVDGVIARRAADVMRMVNDMVNDGKNLGHFIKSLTAHYRNIMLSKSGADLKYIMDSTEESIEQTKEQSTLLSMNEILRSIDVLTKLEAQSRWATQPRIHLEMTLVKLMQPETDQTVEGLLARVEKLETAVMTGNVVAVQPQAKPQLQSKPQVEPAVQNQAVKQSINESTVARKSTPTIVEDRKQTETSKKVPQTEEQIIDQPVAVNTVSNSEGTTAEASTNVEQGSVTVSYNQIQSQWGQILEIVRKTRVQVQAFLIEGIPACLDGGTLLIAFKDGYGFHMDMIEREENRKVVELALEKTFHQNIRIRCDYDYNISVKSEDEKVEDLSDEETVKSYFKEHEDKLKIID